MRVDPLVLALINARQAQGITQKELSVRTGIRPSMISEWETGKVHPQPHNVRRVAAALGIDLGDGDDEAAA